MKTLDVTENHMCGCGSRLEQVDAAGNSATMRCTVCKRCTLVVDHPRFDLYIGLSDFHIKRGNKDGQRSLGERGMATRLVQCLGSDEWPSPATALDFGIDSSEHYLALQHAVRQGITAYDLDRVMGDGPAITQMVHGVPNQPCRFVRFRTAWDDYREYCVGR